MTSDPPAGPGPAEQPGGLPLSPAADVEVLRATGRISAITALARIAGFARWLVLGYAVGTTYLGNVYQSANTLPNVMFELAAGGLLSAVLVPTFVSEIRAGRERGLEIAASLTNTLLLFSIPVVVAGLVFAEPIMGLLLAGVADPEIRGRQIELGAWFLRFFLPQIPLYILGVVMQGILHAHRRFVMPALAPLLSSLTVIATYIAFRLLGPGVGLDSVSRLQLWVLAGGTTLGVAVLAFCQLPAVIRLGVRWRPIMRWRDPAVRRALRAGGWGIAYFGITQIGLLLTVVLANRVEGGVVGFQIANAFFELPNAIIGLPVAISLFPSLSDAYARGDQPGFARLLSRGWRLATFGGLPAAAGLFVLAPVLSEALLGWAPLADAVLVSSALRGLSIGVPAWILAATVVRSFYSRHSTAPPAAMNLITICTYAAISVPMIVVRDLTGPSVLRVMGLSLGLGHLAGVTLGVFLLARRVPGWALWSDLRSAAASAGRALALGAASWLVVRWLAGPAPVVAVAAALAGAVIFAALAVRSRDLRDSLALLRGGGR